MISERLIVGSRLPSEIPYYETLMMHEYTLPLPLKRPSLRHMQLQRMPFGLLDVGDQGGQRRIRRLPLGDLHETTGG